MKIGIEELKKAFKSGWSGIIFLFTKLKEHINNLQKINKQLEHKNQSLESKNQSLENENQLLEAKIKSLLAEKVKNSHNSSKPPSTDGLKKKTKSLRTKSNRKSGGQHGHKGTTLEISENPDFIETIQLHKYSCCGKKIHSENKSFVSRQVIDLQNKKVVIEYRAECSICPDCNQKSIAEFPSFCSQSIQYSQNIKALCIYLNKYQLIPLKRVTELFSDIYNIKISQGSIVNFNKQMYEKLGSFEEEMKESMLQSELIHSDESGGRCQKKLYWFQVVSNSCMTYIAIHAKRGKDAMKDIGILSNFTKKVVHDFYKSYFQFDYEHVLCNAHLLRELIFEKEVNLQTWAGQMIELLLKIKEKVDSTKEEGKLNSLSKYYIRKYEIEYDKILRQGLENNPYKNKECKKRGRPKQTSSRNLLDRLKEYKNSYLGFMHNFDVPFDNNLAERDIRMLKVYMKISGCFRSFNGAIYFCRIRSYISTVRKNNINVFDSIKNALGDQPFSLMRAE